MALPAIEVKGLTKRFDKVTAVDGIAFAVVPGTTVALLGGNGAGKTTTLAMLLGLLEPTAGEVRVLGHDMRRERA
jgi:ABC-2 type transport system ATP-binding protein